MRPWLALLAALVLTACDSGAPRPALLDSRPPPGLSPRFLAPEGWAWGAIQPPHGPELRYGVTAPAGAARRAQVLILPDSDEPAEVWFETAADLTRAGYVVWTLEWAGFGGSGRLLPPHDMVHPGPPGTAPQALEALITQVIRPRPDRPLTLLASGDAAATALATLARQTPTGSVILSAPDLSNGPALQPWEGLAVRVGLGRLPSPGWRPWSRTASEAAMAAGADPWRGRVAHGWRLANPDLRQSGDSLAWRAQQTQLAADDLAAIRPRPTLVLAGEAVGLASAAACRETLGCRAAIQPQLGSSPHLAPDLVRDAWFAEVTTFLDAQVPPAAQFAGEPDAIE
jgi:lysophospholipase